MTKYNRAFYIIGGLILSAALVMVVWASYTNLWPMTPLVLNNQPFAIKQTTFHPGDAIGYEADSCRTGAYDVTIYPVLRSETGEDDLNLTPANYLTKPGCSHAINAALFVPIWAKPGKYHLELNYHIKVTDQRTITITGTTESFYVVKE